VWNIFRALAFKCITNEAFFPAFPVETVACPLAERVETLLYSRPIWRRSLFSPPIRCTSRAAIRMKPWAQAWNKYLSEQQLLFWVCVIWRFVHPPCLCMCDVMTAARARRASYSLFSATSINVSSSCSFIVHFPTKYPATQATGAPAQVPTVMRQQDYLFSFWNRLKFWLESVHKLRGKYIKVWVEWKQKRHHLSTEVTQPIRKL